MRLHGTTKEKPLERFEGVEREALGSLPECRYEVAVWKSVKLHPDCHIVFDNAYYSAPFRLVGQGMTVRGTAQAVDIFHEWSHVASHPRARRRGERVTDRAHLPPEKLQGLMPVPAKLREEAERIGPSTLEVVDQLLGDRPLDRLRGAQGIVRLGGKYGAVRLEKACERANFYGEISYRTIRNILKKGLDSVPIPEEAQYFDQFSRAHMGGHVVSQRLAAKDPLIRPENRNPARPWYRLHDTPAPADPPIRQGSYLAHMP